MLGGTAVQFFIHLLGVVLCGVSASYATHNESSKMFVRTMHRVSAVVAQAVLTPVVHVASAVHALHGGLPEAESVPAAHYTYEER